MSIIEMCFRLVAELFLVISFTVLACAAVLVWAAPVSAVRGTVRTMPIIIVAALVLLIALKNFQSLVHLLR